MRRALVVWLAMFAAGWAVAEVPPLKAKVGEMVEGIACASDPTQTYTLYLPHGFTNDRQWPLLLVFDPRGRSEYAAGLFRDAADTHGWIIVSSDNTQSDTTWEPNLIALQALWPEVHSRIPADPKRIYATGFSGGAAVATLLAKTSGGVAGILACGGRFFPSQLEDPELAIFSTAGDTDFNFLEMHWVDEYLAEHGNPHRLVIFDGPHNWMTPAVAGEAIGWFELIAMKRGLREPDPELVASLWASDIAASEALESEGRLIEAARRLREMEGDYAGLRDTTEIAVAARRIEAGDTYRSQLKQMNRAEDYEVACVERRDNYLTVLRLAEVTPPTRQLANSLRIEEMQKTSRLPGIEGLAAQRCLNAYWTAVGFYLPDEMLPKQQYAQLAVSYELALMIRDDSPRIWYNLGCARARLGQKRKAVEALARALELGFKNLELLETDPDLDPLRSRDDFKALVASAENRETPAEN
jgi:predicted esterase